MSHKKGPKRIFYQFFFILLFFECSISKRLICKKLSTLSAKRIFLWGCKHSVYAASFEAKVTSCYIRNIIPRFTSGICNYINTIYIAKWLQGNVFVPIVTNLENLVFKYLRKTSTTCKKDNILMQKRFDFYRVNLMSFSIMSQLR